MGEQEMLAFALEPYTCYPSEAVRLYLRLGAFGADEAGYAQVILPPALALEGFHLANGNVPGQVYTSEANGKTLLEWRREAGEEELVISARVALDAPQGYFGCQAGLFDPASTPLARSEQRLLVKRRADPLKYLPEIYSRDDFTNRFLMLIDSFWKPISNQIDQIDSYFDPYLTPPEFLSWLASWFGLELEKDLPEDRQRALVAKIAPILARNGTRQALEEFLELYTGGQASVREYRDRNFSLGQETYLGYQIALGKQNRPFSFEVHLKVPALAHPDEAGRQQYARRIESLVSMFRPAHAVFSLAIEYV